MKSKYYKLEYDISYVSQDSGKREKYGVTNGFHAENLKNAIFVSQIIIFLEIIGHSYSSPKITSPKLRELSKSKWINLESKLNLEFL